MNCHWLFLSRTVTTHKNCRKSQCLAFQAKHFFPNIINQISFTFQFSVARLSSSSFNICRLNTFPGFCYCRPFRGTSDSIYHRKPSARFSKKREEKEKMEEALLKCSFFQNVCVFVVLSFPWWPWTKCSSVEQRWGSQTFCLYWEFLFPSPNPQTHSKEDKVSFCSATWEAHYCRRAAAIHTLTHTSACVCVNGQMELLTI